jgi:hypothetical protein
MSPGTTSLDARLISDLRAAASSGATADTLIGLVRARREIPNTARVQVFAYLNQALNIPLRELQMIGNWRGFEDLPRAVDDATVESRLEPFLRAWRTGGSGSES